jgi:hypothetical protein
MPSVCLIKGENSASIPEAPVADSRNVRTFTVLRQSS